ncbi:YebG family protein [Marinobacter caseinilyticus]|uniref:YebG family protein n=1 Tax=Marinobacter caseinilyticus TaxID=2692195 RepID=UPI0014092074|nr:YebG family protein [Marinobacter caseinilyticus]
MAVKTLYYTEKDGLDVALKNPDTMIFSSKAEADARDRILELSEEISVFLQAKVSDINEETAEACAMAIAEHSELFKKAFKKPSVLNTPEDEG